MAVLPRSQVTTPHPVPLPLGEGTPEWRSAGATPFLLHPHSLADADTLRRKLAKASLRGEGQDEGRFAPFKALLLHRDGTAKANSRPYIFNREK